MRTLKEKSRILGEYHRLVEEEEKRKEIETKEENERIVKITKINPNRTRQLTLQLKKEFFDMILTGEKKIEYREITTTTQGKYIDIFSPNDIRIRPYDTILFINGYRQDSRRMVVEIEKIEIDEDGTIMYYLGDIISTKHC